MRFSAIAVSAAILGVAMAVPTVVMETEVVTIISCAPEKTDCPGRIHSTSSTPAVLTPAVYTPPVVLPTYSIPTYSSIPTYTSIPTYSSIPTHSSIPIPSSNCSTSYNNGTASVPPYTRPTVSLPGIVSAVASTPASTYAWTPSASAGIPSAPANTSTPVVPSTPPPYKGAASIKGFSFAAVAIAAAAFVLA